MFKIFVLSLLASVSLQAHVEYEVGGFIDDAKQALQKLIDQIEAAISAAIKQIEAAFKDLSVYGDEIIKQYTFKIQEEFRKLVEQLAQIKADAKQGGIDISDCLIGNEAKFASLPVECTTKVVGCVTSKIEEAKGIVVNATEDLLSTMNAVNAVKQDLAKCGTGIEAIACVTRVVAKISGLSISLPIKIAGEAARAVRLLVTLKASMKQCVDGSIIEMVAEGVEILANITNCVNAKNTTNVFSEERGVDVIYLDDY